MASQRTGGPCLKIHKLAPRHSGHYLTLCGRHAADVAFVRINVTVTCKRCLRALYGEPEEDDGTGMSADEKAWLG